MSNVFSRILVGIDGSDASNEAVTLAARLAREQRSQLIFCHSVHWAPVISGMSSSGTMLGAVPIIDDLKQAGEELLDRARATAMRAGVEAETRMVENEPAQRILELATDEKCSLIVMGTHGRQGLQRLVLGSTTEGVLRESTIPVLTVHAGMKHAATSRRCFESIVVGIDESEPSDAAIQTVLELPVNERRRVLFCSAADLSNVARERAQRALGKAIGLARARDFSVSGLVISGTPHEALLIVAQQQGADIIVLGSHGRHGFQRLFLGSVAESIVRTAPLPVLVVRVRERVPVLARAAYRAKEHGGNSADYKKQNREHLPRIDLPA
jgi:nucleotide-binding universal stress UspA family protein